MNNRINDIGQLVKDNSYVGRGIIIGKSADSESAVFAYFIMGRSENSRNRIFVDYDGEIRTEAFDPSKVEDPSLIIYSAVRQMRNKIIVTNGDHTDTIYDFIKSGKTFKEALETREFEPDAPNFTPRISGMIEFSDADFSYEMSILKALDSCGSKCCRYTFSYPSQAGAGHFIHTYQGDGNPLPSFSGEPEPVEIPSSIDTFTETLWNNLNEANKISLVVRYIDIGTGEYQQKIVNKNQPSEVI